ncbi:MAG: hypothetical protein EA398_00795 [Deltaproteobacteria bacterium]|nr:MAG: hypothetical protein EA398_00795 [Deltaproteobacteria bacterium]
MLIATLRPHLPTLIGLVCFALAGGCGARQGDEGAQQAAQGVEVERFAFEGAIIEARPTGDGGFEVIDHDAVTLFEEATEALSTGAFEEALAGFDRIIDYFRDEEIVRLSLYNGAVALEMLERCTAAIERYRLVRERWPGSDEAVDAALGRAECFTQLAREEEALAELDELLDGFSLTHAARVEAELRRAHLLLSMDRLVDAEAGYRTVLRLQSAAVERRDPDPGAEPLPAAHPHLAQAHFGRGRVLHALFLDVRFSMPEDRFRRDLVAKGEMLDEARGAYMGAVRLGNPYWSPAAGYMIGRLYEDFYLDVLATEMPDDFSDLEVQSYFRQMRDRLAPAIRMAKQFYRQTLVMVYRIGGEAVWIEALVEAVERLERYIREEEGWEDEHELIRQGRHPRDARPQPAEPELRAHGYGHDEEPVEHVARARGLSSHP